MRRINVVGTSCSGKTTLARAIADRLSLRYVEFDALYWGPEWTPMPAPLVRERLRAALSADEWVADGAYSDYRDITWERVETVVWLDYPMPIVLGRWARRTLARIRSREEFWPGTGNRESLRNALRRGGLLWWILRTHRSRRRRTLEQLAHRSHVQVIRLRSPAATERWLATVGD